MYNEKFDAHVRQARQYIAAMRVLPAATSSIESYPLFIHPLGILVLREARHQEDLRRKRAELEDRNRSRGVHA